MLNFNKVSSFEILNGYYIHSSSVTNLNDNFKSDYLEFNNIFRFGENVIAIDDLNKGIIISNNKILFDFSEMFRISSYNFPYLIYYKKTTPRTYGVFNFINSKILFETEIWIGNYIFKDHVFGESIGIITSRKIDNHHILWQTDISQIGKHIPFPDEEEKEGEVKNFVGVYNKELIVQLTGGKFIGLDLENGKVNWEQNLVENNLTNQIIDYNFGDPYNPFLDEENGKIYILQGEVFIVLDLLTKKATYQWSSLNLPTEDYVFIRQSNIYNNQIVFSAFRKGNIGNDDTIGIFDIEKNEIIWKHTFNFEKDNFIPNSNTNIQMSENRIGALDWKGNLYIFEREKNK